MPLQRRREPFDHPDWLFALKYDGFRALAVIQPGRTQLMSRNGYPLTVIDGEIACVDRRGRPQFKDLLFHRCAPCFFAFELLMLRGKD